MGEIGCIGIANQSLHHGIAAVNVGRWRQVGTKHSKNSSGSYVPVYLANQALADSGNTELPRIEKLQASALFLDISGFTNLTHTFAQEGPDGTEKLTLALDGFFGKVNETIAEFGGDVENIAGDAVLAFWHADASGDPNRADGDGPVRTSANCAGDAIECAAALLQRYDNHPIGANIELRLRAAVVSGEMFGLHVGGVESRWNFLLAGDPLYQITNLIDEASPSQVIADSATIDLVGGQHQFENIGHGTYKLKSVPNGKISGPLTRPAHSPALQGKLKKYLPRTLQRMLEADQMEWSAELREVTVAFVNLTGLQCSSESDLAGVQDVITKVQEIIYRFGGSLQAITMNDKGPVLMTVFGLPHQAHQDDAYRAVLAMRELHGALGALWLDCTCGIATGPAYCGPIGSDARRIYSVRGNVVNLAARFTQAEGYRVLCDEATMQAAGEKVQFEAMPPLNLKGLKTATSVYRPRSERQRTKTKFFQCVGRENELEIISARLDNCNASGRGGVIGLEGDAGIGKSHLIEAVIDEATSRGFNILSGATDTFNTNTPYLAWREPFIQLLSGNSNKTVNTNKILATVRDLLSDDDALLERIPLLSVIMPETIADNSLTAQMSGEVRADNTREVLCSILSRAFGDKPHLLVLDDVHWMDTASWQLAEAVIRQCENMIMVLASRPSAETGNEYFSALTENSRATVLNLDVLGKDSVREMVTQSLDVKEVAPNIVEFIFAKSQGNPYYSQEMALALRDANHLETHDGNCRLANHVESLETLEFPNTIEKIIISRIDLLQPSLQLTLKVASVIGRIFQYRILEGVYPIGEETEELPVKLDKLENLNITVLAQKIPELNYSFKHIITHDVIYKLLLFSQRRELHRAVSIWIESNLQTNIEADYPLLARHWRLAENYENAAHYFELAGQSVLRGGTNRESIELFEGALEALSHIEGDRDRLREARIRRLLGEASIRTGALESAQVYLMGALKDLGYKWPGSQIGLGMSLVGEMGQQLFRQLPLIKNMFKGSQSEKATETAYVYEQLLQLFYFTNRSVEMAVATGKETNWSERSSDLQLRAQAKLLFGNVMGIFGMHGAARRYHDKLFVESLPSSNDGAWKARNNQFRTLYLASVGQWEQCLKLMRESLDIAEELGDSRYRREFLSLLGIVTLPMGKTVEAREYREKFFEAAQTADDQQTRCWAYIEMGEFQLHQGELSEAVLCFEAANAFLGHVSDAEGIWSYGQLGKALWRLDRHNEAIAAAGECLKRMQRTLPVGFYTVEGYLGAGDVFISALEAGYSNDTMDRGKLIANAKASLGCANAFARSFPISKPRLALLRGRLAKPLGKPAKAMKLFAQATGFAVNHNLPYDLALVQYYQALGTDDPVTRAELLETAARSFEYLNNSYELALVQDELTKSNTPHV